MFVKRIQKIVKRYFKRYFRMTVVSLIAAAVVTLVINNTTDPGSVSMAPKSVNLPDIIVVYIQTFLAIFSLRLVLRLIKRNFDKLKRVWDKWIRDPLVSLWNRASRRGQAIMVGFAVAVIAGGITAAVGVVYPIPPSLISVVFVFVWPIGTYGALTTITSTENTTSATSSLLVSSRYAELRQLETRAVATLFGFLIAAVAGVGIWYVGADLSDIAVLFGLVWLGGTIAVYKRYETTVETRTDLTIASIETATSTDQMELSIKNRGDRTVELTNATIRDTNCDLYQLATDITLHPGSCYTFKLPSDFSLSPNDDERGLPLGYTLYQGQEYPVVYSQDGFAFELHRSHTDTRNNNEWTDNTGQFEPQSKTVPNTASSQDD